jgi:hypothetical protein
MSKFTGGMSHDLKEGFANSFAYSKSINFRKSPTQLTLYPKTVKSSGNTVTDLVTNSCMVSNGDLYFIGDTGNFYKRAASDGTWSLIGDVGTDTAYGLVYRQDQDIIYIMKSTDVATYYPVSGTPSLTASKYATSVDQSLTGGASHYDLTTGVNEGATHKQTFTPEYEPLYSIKVWVVAKGTGNWTLTVHDDANNVIGTSTVANGSLSNGALNEFVLSSVGRMLVKPNARTYHFHLTSSVADGTCMTTTVHDLETADFQTLASRLISTQNGMHPAILFQQYMCVGNERYLSVFEPLADPPLNTQWQRHKLTFPPGYEVCGLAIYDEFIAVACEKRSSSSSKEFQDGKIFFWDGTAGTYNYFIDVPEGSPFSMFSHKNILYYIAGGEWFAYAGGQPVALRKFPNIDGEYTDANHYIVNYPYTGTIRNGVLLQGFPSETSNATIEHGVYSYGATNKNYPNSFGYDFKISTGTKLCTNTLRIGHVKNYGEELFISWRDNTTYGVDIVNNSSDPATSASFESLIIDDGKAYKEKLALDIDISFETLPANVSITPKYKIDRGAWVTGTAVTSGTTSRLSINKRFKEIQVGFDIVSTATATPVITSVSFNYDDLKEEKS